MPRINVSEYTLGEQGRIAFWHGREIWANPHIHDQAVQWRAGWLAAERDFKARAGGVKTPTRLASLRPSDLPPPKPFRRVTPRGGGRRAAAAEQRDEVGHWGC